MSVVYILLKYINLQKESLWNTVRAIVVIRYNSADSKVTYIFASCKNLFHNRANINNLKLTKVGMMNNQIYENNCFLHEPTSNLHKS